MDYEKLCADVTKHLAELMKQQGPGTRPQEDVAKVFADAIVYAIKCYDEAKA